mmetsp:Transcript_98396/g.195096  ORF Transcript_98396/g.195096 Transcript_98396/m.195096 type:complete len:201 (+) Transcript_98396:192-794(+)
MKMDPAIRKTHPLISDEIPSCFISTAGGTRRRLLLDFLSASCSEASFCPSEGSFNTSSTSVRQSTSCCAITLVLAASACSNAGSAEVGKPGLPEEETSSTCKACLSCSMVTKVVRVSFTSPEYLAPSHMSAGSLSVICNLRFVVRICSCSSDVAASWSSMDVSPDALVTSVTSVVGRTTMRSTCLRAINGMLRGNITACL